MKEFYTPPAELLQLELRELEAIERALERLSHPHASPGDAGSGNGKARTRSTNCA